MTQITILKINADKDIRKTIKDLTSDSGLTAKDHPLDPDLIRILSLNGKGKSLAAIKKGGVWIMGPAEDLTNALHKKGVVAGIEHRHYPDSDSSLTAIISIY